MLRPFLAGELPLYAFVMFIASIVAALTFHEFAHGFAAYILGDRTAKQDGRLSFNPARHIDPIGMMLLLVAGFGWAKPVMVNPYNLRNPKQDMAFISIAGPVSNFLLAFVVLLIAQALLMFGGTGNAAYYTINFFYLLCSINIGLGLFNMIPIPPLDGSKFFGFFLPDPLYFKLMNFRYGMIILIALVFFGEMGNVLWTLVNTVMDGYTFVIVRILSVFA